MTEEKILKNTYYALRHGQSEKNELDLVVSYPESRPYHLTEQGRQQVTTAANWLQTKNIDLIFASDLTRTKESADIVAQALDIKVQFDERIRELNFGEFNNKSRQEFHAFFKDVQDLEERYNQAPPKGENWQQLVARLVDFLTWVEQQYAGKNILIISHGDPLWLLQWASQCLALEKLKDIPYPETGQPFKLEVKCLPNQ